MRAIGVDLLSKRVMLDDGESLPYDRLIATGTRAGPWPNAEEGALEGVFTLRTCEDAERLAAGPERVLVIGGGFTGSEIVSACRERGLEVTLAERGPAPLMGAFGVTLSKLAAVMQRNHRVDLRTGVTVTYPVQKLIAAGQAAYLYSLMTPPSTRVRRSRCAVKSVEGTGCSWARGGSCPRAWWGR